MFAVPCGQCSNLLRPELVPGPGNLLLQVFNALPKGCRHPAMTLHRSLEAPAHVTA